ncbi:MoaE-domain-containing protein [Serendipita vermifera]|nr:MoaE-domain-containing protein [Serendipita vermifera]
MDSPFSITAELTTETGDICVLTFEELKPEVVLSSVSMDEAGAIASFIGQTRNNFQGRPVTHLEYHAYTALAIKTMQAILQEARGRATSSLSRIALHHRLGQCGVGEISIIVAVSSPHRKEAFEACSWIVDEVKGKVQVFKKEYYGDGDKNSSQSAWKDNKEV